MTYLDFTTLLEGDPAYLALFRLFSSTLTTSSDVC